MCMCVYVRVWVGGLHHLPRRCVAEHPRDRHGSVLALSVCWSVCKLCSLKIECVLYRYKLHSVYVGVCARTCVRSCTHRPTHSHLFLSLSHHESVCVCPIKALCVCPIDTDCWVFITRDWEQFVECPPCVCGVCVCVCVCVCVESLESSHVRRSV